MRVAASGTRPAWASGSKNLDALGMNADLGTDQDSLATHSDQKAEDMETTDSRPKQ